MTKTECDYGPSVQTAYEYTYTGDGIRHLKKDYLATKEYRYGCSIDCGGMPLRVYSRELGSQGEWSNVEDYLQVGTALGYGQNWQFAHSGGELLMMGASGEPREYYPHDSNGLSVQSEPSAPCVCVVQPQTPAVCPPLGYGGCEGGICEGFPATLPPSSGSTANNFHLSPQGVGIIIGVVGGLIGGPLYIGGCAGAAAGVGKGTLDACNQLGYEHCDKLAHCVGMCVARKCGTRLLSWCLGWLRDPPFIGDPADRSANYEGEKCAVSSRGLHGCVVCCVKWWVKRY